MASPGQLSSLFRPGRIFGHPADRVGPAAFWQLTGLLPVHGAGWTGVHSHLRDLLALLKLSFSPQKESGANDVEQGSIAPHCTPQSDHQEPLYMHAGVGDLVTARNKSCLWQEPQLCSE